MQFLLCNCVRVKGSLLGKGGEEEVWFVQNASASPCPGVTWDTDGFCMQSLYDKKCLWHLHMLATSRSPGTTCHSRLRLGVGWGLRTSVIQAMSQAACTLYVRMYVCMYVCTYLYTLCRLFLSELQDTTVYWLGYLLQEDLATWTITMIYGM